jgi:hypothetical protein
LQPFCLISVLCPVSALEFGLPECPVKDLLRRNEQVTWMGALDWTSRLRNIYPDVDVDNLVARVRENSGLSVPRKGAKQLGVKGSPLSFWTDLDRSLSRARDNADVSTPPADLTLLQRWFSPLSRWLQRRLEAISKSQCDFNAAALAALSDLRSGLDTVRMDVQQLNSGREELVYAVEEGIWDCQAAVMKQDTDRQELNCRVGRLEDKAEYTEQLIDNLRSELQRLQARCDHLEAQLALAKAGRI